MHLKEVLNKILDILGQKKKIESSVKYESFCLQIVLNPVQSGLKVENLLAHGIGTLERRLSELA